MKKYRLIKTYPGSPKLGYITKPKGDSPDLNSYYYEGSWFAPSQFKEFWEEVIEKDYEVLSIVRKNDSKRILLVKDYNENGAFLTNWETNSPYFNPNKFNSEKDSFEYINDNFNIYSVKRLSDGEIFTVGDKIKTFDCGYKPISSIRIENNICKIGVREHGLRDLKNCKKQGISLFTTEDGIDIFEGDEYWIAHDDKFGVDSLKWKVNNKPYKCDKIIPTKREDFAKNGNYRFSSKEKAEEYILMNKPCLSLSDYYSMFNEDIRDYGIGEKLKKLVKSKL